MRKNTNPRPVPGCTLESTPTAFGCILSSESWKSRVRTQSTPRMGICPTVSTPKIQSVIDTFFWKTFLKRSFSTKHTGPCLETPTRDTIRGARRNRHPNSAGSTPQLWDVSYHPKAGNPGFDSHVHPGWGCGLAFAPSGIALFYRAARAHTPRRRH